MPNEPKEPHFGPTIGIIIIVAVMLIGAGYFYTTHLKQTAAEEAAPSFEVTSSVIVE